MQKLDARTDGQTKNIVAENIEKLKELFPEAFTEGKIDVDALKELIGEFADDREERYSFTWNGKSKARMIAQTPSTGTLRPCKEESVDWDTTQNIFIEGDNLEVLKLLQKSYHKKVKMIYIDPPYNTGNEFIYPDNYQDNLNTYLKYTGQITDEGFKIGTNSEVSGRYHTNWINMIYPRLKIARQLLSEKGVLFFSIGQAELANSVAILDELFGEENRISICTRMMKSGGQKGKFFSPNTDYVLVYAKQIEHLEDFRGEISQELQDKVYNQIEENEPRKGERYRSMGLYQPTLDSRTNQRYYIQCPDGSYVIPPGTTIPKTVEDCSKIKPVKGDGVWRWTPERYLIEKDKGNILYKETNTSPLIDENGQQSNWNIYTKIWLKDRLEDGSLPLDLFDKFENRHSSKEIAKLKIPFDYSKPTDLISYLMQIINTNDSDIVLDFFAGSCSTADASMKYSKSSNKSVRFICVQLPELISSDDDAFKQGFKTIAEIGKERIRRAANQIKKENPDYLGDLGFKVFKLDSTNIKPWEADFDNIERTIDDYITNIKHGRTEHDILYEILLKYGLNLTIPVEERSIDNRKVFVVGMGALVICLANDISLKTAEGIALLKKELQPEVMRVVFKDTGFKDDVVKTNAMQILRQNGIDDVKSL